MPIPNKQHVEPPFPDYYPFGSMMPGRNGGNDYEYGFNGMRGDDALKGNNNSYDFGARMYDPRLGRWMSRDPEESIYASYSPYNFVLNNPITNIDPDGRRTYFAPGLGNNPYKPAPYVRGVIQSFGKYLGTDFFMLGCVNYGTASDSKFVYKHGQKPTPKSERDIRVVNAVEEIKDDIMANPLNGDEFNIIGTSMGSVTAAQTAVALIEDGLVGTGDGALNKKIDKLVLVGSPIDQNSELYKKLKEYEKNGLIGDVVYEEVQMDGDLVTGCAGTNKKECRQRGVDVFDSFIKHGLAQAKASPGYKPDYVDPHAALAEKYSFGEDLAKMLLGEFGIEGDTTKTMVSQTSTSSIYWHEEAGKFVKSRPSF